MANLKTEDPIGPTAQSVTDAAGNSTALSLSTGSIGIGTTRPTQLLTLGNGNVLLPNARLGSVGNLYFGGVTDAGFVGMRLFGGNVNGTLPSGFIDVRAGTTMDGLRVRVDLGKGDTERFRITAEGNVGIGNAAPTERLVVEGNIVVSGDIRLTNADLAEDFNIVTDCAIEPGTVMVLTGEDSLAPCGQAYDKRVAGVVSGAGHFKPAIVLDRQIGSAPRATIALVGKTYCMIDADYGIVDVGDLLTTSPTLGHAMRASDQQKAFGSVIGKALRSLKSGRGLVPILVTLQ